jgi:hypothetical protein
LSQNPSLVVPETSPWGVMATLLKVAPKAKLTCVPVEVLVAVSQVEALAPEDVATKADADVMRQEKPPLTVTVTAVLELLAGWLPARATALDAAVEKFTQPVGKHRLGADASHDGHAPPELVNPCHIT